MREDRTFKIVRVVGLAFFTLITLFPLYTVVVSSIKPLADVRSAFQWVPSRIRGSMASGDQRSVARS